MSNVTFGISPECLCHDVRDNVSRVGQLEDAGFEFIWEGDHTLPWQHSAGHSSGIFTTLAAFLANTKRATVGGMVIPALGIRHHPIDVAIEVATQALLYPGRVALCVGTGEAMNEKTTTGFWPHLRERIERTIEGIDLIKKAWSSEDYFEHKGKYFRSFFFLYTKPAEHIPLLCAAQGPIMARNAGLYSEGYVAVGVPPSHHKEVLIPAFEQGAREAGKDPDALMKCAWVSTAYHPSMEKAIEGARVYGGLLIPEAYSFIQDPRTIEQRALLVKDDALVQAFCVASSGEEIIRRFEAFIEAGCNHILWADMSPDPALVAGVNAKEVLPYLKNKYGAKVAVPR
ncbi:MAG TPA: LLM class flavin-dependent oxidoreductase [Methylomirabilota bacterium]|nr:LLM class flavin-dependent oxidoreductase [Methylomirabilota bacterium]